MSEEKDQKPIADDAIAAAEKESAPEQQYKQITFPSQPDAYKWLQLECPKQYHFSVGARNDTGELVVLITIPVDLPVQPQAVKG